MKQTVLLCIAILCFAFNGYTQVCGGGILDFNIFTLNGTEVKYFEYEIFPVSEKLAKDLGEGLHADYKGKIMYGFSETKIDTTNTFLNTEFKSLLAESKITSKGKIKSSLHFKTHETLYFPVILKITHDKKTVYILGNYFGGCNRKASLVWGNHIILN